MGYGTTLLMIVCIAFGVMITVPIGNSGKAFQNINGTIQQLEALQKNSSTSGTTTGTFNIINDLQIAKATADFLASIGGAVWDVFGSFGELPSIVKTFLIVSLLFMVIFSSIAFWLNRSGD